MKDGNQNDPATDDGPGIFQRIGDWTAETSQTLVRNHPLKSQVGCVLVGTGIAKYGKPVARGVARKARGLFGGATESVATVAAESTVAEGGKSYLAAFVKASIGS